MMKKRGKGSIRHIVVKIGVHTNEVMVVLVVNSIGETIKDLKGEAKEKELVKELIENFKNIKTVVKNINTKNTNVIMGGENVVLYGEGYIYDKLGEYTFKISPLSFYQINPIQTEKLYQKAVEFADLKKDDIVLDLYCGIGTIGIFVSKYVKYVLGVEVVEQAVEDAKENARINKVDNIEFICGDTKEVLEKLIHKKGINPDVIFVDPPRKGLDAVSIDNIMKAKPEKVVYVSCNPATLVRDLRLLEKLYKIGKIQPVDMFPFTSHVECCSVLYLKDSIQ